MAFLIDDFLGPGRGLRGGWFFRCAVIAERMLFCDGRRHVCFFISRFIQHAVASFGKVVSAALWFLIRCVFTLVLWLGIFLQTVLFSSVFLLLRGCLCWCSDKSLPHFFGDEISSEIAL